MRAIDVHVHVPRQPGLPPRWNTEQMQRYFRAAPRPKDATEMAARFKELDIFGVLFSVDAETVTGEPPDSNDYVASIVRQYPHQFIGFASVDPWKGKQAVQEVERSVKELGLRGLKLHPPLQAFFPNDQRFYPLYAKCSELRIPVLFHSGHSAAGSTLPGGGGIKLKYAAPIPYIDDVAADFPELTIIMAHPGWPWTQEQISVAVHKANVYIDLSGWAPQYFPEELVHNVNTRIQDKVLYGSDYPSLQPDRWLREFDAMPIRDEVRPKILLENAKKVLKLDL
ncbi:MAG: amidohydrolase [Chloroflexi bacterium]|nr:amidohydrolase [Chloroflexota bacterium]